MGLFTCLVLAGVMLPVRSHIAPATAGLVLVLPVLAGVVTGGLFGGVVSSVAGFLVYDYFFIPPYESLTVGASAGWVALVVYVVVMVTVSQVVAGLDRARAASSASEANARYLLDLSELLLADRSIPELAEDVVEWARRRLGAEGASLLLSDEGHLEMVASTGLPLPADQLARLNRSDQHPVPLTTGMSSEPVQALALTTAGRPIGLLVLQGLPPRAGARELLPIMANDLAVAFERAQLRQVALRNQLLEEVERLRASLLGAVSHDLRAPLATIKVASSTFLTSGPELGRDEAMELHTLIDAQVDRLTRLVNSLLDMTRIQSGALEVRRRPMALGDLVQESVSLLSSALDGRAVELELPAELPAVEVDPVLTVQVLTNLIDNANRYGPPGSPMMIAAVLRDGTVEVAVTDSGPGVPEAERRAIFERFVRFDSGGRSGLGLAIAKAFVEAQGGRIWAAEAPGGGGRFVFTLAVAPGPVPAA